MQFGRYQHFRGACFLRREACSFHESVESRLKIHISVTRTRVQYHCRFLWGQTSSLHVTWSLARSLNPRGRLQWKLIFVREFTESCTFWFDLTLRRKSSTFVFLTFIFYGYCDIFVFPGEWIRTVNCDKHFHEITQFVNTNTRTIIFFFLKNSQSSIALARTHTLGRSTNINRYKHHGKHNRTLSVQIA